MNKVKTAITGITINAPTYSNVSFNPTLINFFYGKNGTGKSTLAKAFLDGSAAFNWKSTPFPKDQILVYNEEFIRKNVQSYGNIPGVFTISEVNAEKKKLADEKSAEKATADAQAEAVHNEAEKITAEHKKDESNYFQEIWKKTEATRKKYPDTQTGYKADKDKFATKLANMPMMSASDEECEALYRTVFGKQRPRYEKYFHVHTDQISVSPLMETSIVSRSDTPFANFIRALGSMDWVSAGHNAYHKKADGKCPYCQRDLPPKFEEDLATCYDEQYKTDLQALGKFITNYSQDMDLALGTIEKNLQNHFPTKNLSKYKQQVALLAAAINHNRDLLQKKKDNPGEVIILDDLVPISAELNSITSEINDEVQAYLDVLADIPGQQQKCIEMVWGMMANDCSAEMSRWLQKTSTDRDAWKEKKEVEKKLREKSAELEKEIAKLNSETVNTTKTMIEINRSIRNAGFKGFELQEKPGAKYVYQLVRNINGKTEVVDQDLSEGERHFIAFLYFYHTVMGSQSDDGRIQDKIVIIDDPVSSMDSGSLFIVASLVRELVAVCYNNYSLDEENNDDHIRQFFCLTHNPYFFREITYNRLADYECASFFEITKDNNNQTHIRERFEDIELSGGEARVNVSPVRNTYDTLWHEYCTTDDPETLMVVIRQILEYYFVQMIGYQNENLRKDLLDKHEIDIWEGKNSDDYRVASAMIAMINVGATGFNDGLYFDSSAADVDHLRSVFEKIFTVMKQNQHYDMMTKRAKI